MATASTSALDQWVKSMANYNNNVSQTGDRLTKANDLYNNLKTQINNDTANINTQYSNVGDRVRDQLAGMGQATDQLKLGQADIRQGYDTLYSDVISGLQGAGNSYRQQITDKYAQERGRASQGLINSGLGNSTVRAAMDRGLMFDEQKARIALEDQLADRMAGYQSQLGLARLNYGDKANQDLLGQQNLQATSLADADMKLGQQRLGYLNQASQQEQQARLAQAGMWGGLAQVQQQQNPMGGLGSLMGMLGF